MKDPENQIPPLNIWPTPVIAPEDQERHWISEKYVADNRLRARSRTRNLVRFLFAVFIDDPEPNRALVCVCKQRNCVNPFHYRQSGRTSYGVELGNARRKARLVTRLKAESLNLDAQFKDLLDSVPQPPQYRDLLESLWMVVAATPTTPAVLDEFLRRNPDLATKVCYP